MFQAATKSAGVRNPHSTQANFACVLRFLRCYVAAFRTTAAGVPGRNGYQQSSTPAHLVRELATKFKRRGIQDRTVQSRLRLDVLASRLAHVLYLQVLHYDNRVVFADSEVLCMKSFLILAMRRCHQRLRVLFSKVCVEVEAELIQRDGEDHHLHLLVKYPRRLRCRIW